MRSYTKQQLAQEAGVAPSTVAYYTRIGIIVPDMNAACANGSRSWYRYSEKNLRQIRLVRDLQKSGFGLKQIKQVSEDWKERNLELQYLTDRITKIQSKIVDQQANPK